MVKARVTMLALALGLSLSCSDRVAPAGGQSGSTTGSTTQPTATSPPTTEPTTQTSPPTTPPVTVRGLVLAAADGTALAGASVSSGSDTATTDLDGAFELTVPADTPTISVDRPGWRSTTVETPGQGQELTIELEPVVVRGLRVARPAASDQDRFAALLDLADGSVVNTLVFDTKDETGQVLYESEVEAATRLGTVRPLYDPATLLALADERDLYTITRIVVFEDKLWVAADPEAKLAGAWVDAADEENWEYPIGLAVEACRLGFDEIQFDYVRFPAGRTAVSAAGRIPATSAERSAVIAEFLTRARSELAPLGCALSAAVFGIVMSSPNDEGIGQEVEIVAPPLDAISPMIYPSHYSPGWLGFPDPNDEPAAVVADALADGMPRVTPPTLMRPWIQAFSYNGQQIQAEIREAEARGAGWMLWNASGSYRADWLPTG